MGDIETAAERTPQTVELTYPVLVDEKSDKVESESQRGADECPLPSLSLLKSRSEETDAARSIRCEIPFQRSYFLIWRGSHEYASR